MDGPVLCEISQTQKDKCHTYCHMRNLRREKRYERGIAKRQEWRVNMMDILWECKICCWTWSLPFWPHWQASKSPASSCDCLPCEHWGDGRLYMDTGYPHSYTAFTHRTISPALMLTRFTILKICSLVHFCSLAVWSWNPAQAELSLFQDEQTWSDLFCWLGRG